MCSDREALLLGATSGRIYKYHRDEKTSFCGYMVGYYTLPTTNIFAPENQWLVQMVHFLLGQKANFQVLCHFLGSLT